MKIRIRFSKFGPVKFVGHLDTMRYFQKAMRRAEIPIAYSEGYSPHQIMSFACPLGCGVTSDGEYMDIEIKEAVTSKDALDCLNTAMVDGFTVQSFKELPEKAKNAMASIAASDYYCFYPEDTMRTNFADFEDVNHKILDFLAQEQILITKVTKKSESLLDLKDLIYDFKFVQNEKFGNCFYIMVSSGSTNNIKPELVMDAFLKFKDSEIEDRLRVHRIDLYTLAADGSFISMDFVGQEIC